MSLGRVAGLVLTLLLVGACGGSSGANSPTAKAAPVPTTRQSSDRRLDALDPCTLVTADDAAAFVGEPVIRSTKDLPGECTYVPNGGRGLSTFTQFRVAIQKDPNARATFEDDLRSVSYLQRVTGLGHEASRSTANSQGGGLNILLDDGHVLVLQVTLRSGTPAIDDPKVMDAARTALTRLPS